MLKRYQNLEILLRMKPDIILRDNIQIIFHSIRLFIRYDITLIYIEDKKSFGQSTIYIKLKK